jgi:hypothetical protein
MLGLKSSFLNNNIVNNFYKLNYFLFSLRTPDGPLDHGGSQDPSYPELSPGSLVAGLEKDGRRLGPLDIYSSTESCGKDVERFWDWANNIK